MKIKDFKKASYLRGQVLEYGKFGPDGTYKRMEILQEDYEKGVYDDYTIVYLYATASNRTTKEGSYVITPGFQVILSKYPIEEEEEVVEPVTDVEPAVEEEIK